MKHETMCLDFLTCTCEAIRANRSPTSAERYQRFNNKSVSRAIEREPCKNCGSKWRFDLRDKYVCNTCGDIETKEVAA